MSNKIKKKEFKQVQNQAQEGRSMVEMLGVLAIIGVISIGGIAGYRWGMDKHVSNQILYEMNLNSAQLAMLLQKGNPEGVTLSLGSPYDEGKFRTVDYGFAYACGEEANSGPECLYLDETMYSMTATGLPKRVCNMLSDAAAGLTYASELEINGGADECDDNTGNVVTVFFDIDTTVEGGTPRPEESETRTPAPEVTEPTTSTESATPTTTTKVTSTTTVTTHATTTTTEEDDDKVGINCKHGSLQYYSESMPYCVCEKGWGGKDCSEEGVCSGHGTWWNDNYYGYCSCDYGSGWYGANCDKCSGHGADYDYSGICKRCNSGWGGTDCSEEGACSNHGTWYNTADGGYCYCSSGWGGTDCSEQGACSGHGTWHNTVDGGYCSCNSGWGGTDCSEEGVCSGHGAWNNSGGGYCSCNSGWGGTDCSEEGACSNHGTWYNSRGGYCSCNYGWYGAKCDKCSGHGWSYSSSTGMCVCNSGWGGTDCSTTGYCSNHGMWYNTADGGYCSCNYGWYGADCSEYADCSGHGSWYEKGNRCSCNSNWYGAKCDKCSGHGLSYDANTEKCTCYSGWSGDDCDKCNGHGSGYDANTGICTQCYSGWGGTDCSKEGVYCSNHGSWHNTANGGGYCECYSGFTGDNCDKEEAIEGF